MILNYIWIGLILLAVATGIVQAVCFGQTDIFSAILNSTFASAKTGFEISIGLTGVLSLWMGIMKIGEQAGVVRQMSRVVTPFFTRIFPELLIFCMIATDTNPAIAAKYVANSIGRNTSAGFAAPICAR